MDHHAPTGSLCLAFAEKRRKAEPFIFFFGVLLLVALGMCLTAREAFTQAGPVSAHTRH